MNICVQVFVWTYVFISLGYIPRGGVTRYVRCMFNSLKAMAVPSSVTSSSVWVPASRGPDRHWVWSVFFIWAILICVFLTISDVQHIFTCSSALRMYILSVMCLFKSFAQPLKLGLFVFSLLNFESFLYSRYKSFNGYVLCSIYSQSVTCLFILLMVTFEKQSF